MLLNSSVRVGMEVRVTMRVVGLICANTRALGVLALELGEKLIERALATRIGTWTTVASHDGVDKVWLAPAAKGWGGGDGMLKSAPIQLAGVALSDSRKPIDSPSARLI